MLVFFGMVSAPFDNEQYRKKGDKAIGKPNCYQKVIICPSGLCRLIFVYGGANFALPGAFSLVSAVRFSNGQEALSIDYSGAKYTRFPPKIAAMQKSLFEWLKAANFSTACGTVTLKKSAAAGLFPSLTFTYDCESASQGAP